MLVDIDHMNVHNDGIDTFRTSLGILDNTGYCWLTWILLDQSFQPLGTAPTPNAKGNENLLNYPRLTV